MALFECSNCFKVFKTQKYLDIHCRNGICKKKLKCETCGIVFKSANGFKLHQESKGKNCRDLTCQICGYQSETDLDFALHKATHTGKKLIICRICDAPIHNDKRNLLNHLKSSHVPNYKCMLEIPKQSKCDLCSEIMESHYMYKHTAQCHVKLIFGHMKYNVHDIVSCSLCGLEVKASEYGLHVHIDFSSCAFNVDYRRPRKCLRCNSAFSDGQYDPWHLLAHRNRKEDFQNGLKDWVCTFCGHYSQTSKDYNSHARCCTVRPRCKLCRVPLDLMPDSSTHEENCKNGVVCHVCGKGFRYQSGLNTHMASHQSESSYKCDLCSVECTMWKTYVKHFSSKTHAKNLKRNPSTKFEMPIIRRKKGPRTKKELSLDKKSSNRNNIQDNLTKSNANTMGIIFKCTRCGLEATSQEEALSHLRENHEIRIPEKTLELMKIEANGNENCEDEVEIDGVLPKHRCYLCLLALSCEVMTKVHVKSCEKKFGISSIIQDPAASMSKKPRLI